MYPISLLSILGKLLEHIAGQQVQKVAIATGVLAPTQYAVVTGRSSVDPISINLHHATEVLDTPSNGQKQTGEPKDHYSLAYSHTTFLAPSTTPTQGASQ